MELTSAQKAAVETQNKTLLLSAAAGSGKTSTLTKRIIRSITDGGHDISKMLIVTFTRASAGDLKAKIYEALSDALAASPDSRRLTEQLIALGNAKISTIDAFYLDSVKQNFASLGLSSAFRIADGAEASLIAQGIMTDVINVFYDTDADFPALCECFENMRDAEGVAEEIFLWLYGECMHVPEGVEYLKICAERADAEKSESFIDTSYGEVIRKYACSMFEGYLEAYEDALAAIADDERVHRAYYEPMNEDRILCVKALNMLNKRVENCTYADIAELFSEFSFMRMGSVQAKFATDGSKYAKALRGSFKEKFIKLRNEFFCYSDGDFEQFFALTAKNLDILYRVLSEFEKRFSEEKRSRNILELTDIKRYALRLFANPDGTPTETAKALSEQLTDIYVDEYQDVDPVQDLIFRCISTPHNRFMVGDIKQSIYGFRGALPKLFADYRLAFPAHGTPAAENSGCETIYMSENFRCSKPVIDFTNLVCAPAFLACRESIGYTRDDDLVFAKPTDGNAVPSPKVSVSLFAKRSKKELEEDGIDPDLLPSPAQAEAYFVAQKIAELLKNGKKQNGEPIRPKDIAVLFRNKAAALPVADELSALGIPTGSTEATEYFQNPDVMMTLCILNAIDNPQRDIYLAGAMHSPIFGFTLDDLLRIRQFGDGTSSLYDRLCICASEEGELPSRCRGFAETLSKWRSISLSLPIDKLLHYIFSTDEFVASGLVGGRNALGEGGNLQRLYEYARSFEAGSFKGLYSFIEFINNLIENGQTLEARTDSSDADAVTLTTIHKSKGLEFPICFVCGCAAEFKSGSAADDIAFEYGLGVAMTLSDGTGFAKYASPLKKVLALNSRLHGTEEEIRVLYVALTRAREQLFVTASYPRSLLSGVTEEALFRTKFSCDFSVLDASCFTDFILPAVLNGGNDCAELRLYTTDGAAEFDSGDDGCDCDFIGGLCEEDGGTDAENGDGETDKELYEKLKNSFAFSYPYSSARKIPAKISVSKLSPDALDDGDVSVSLFDTEKSPSVPAFFLGTQKKATAAEKGTATHLFLQFCDFSVLMKDGVKKAAELLVEKRFIPAELAEIIYTDELEKMRGGEFLQKIANAEKIIREQRFNLLLPAREFTADPILKKSVENEKIAVQGVIDLLLINKNGGIELYDYKTDRLTRAELENAEAARKKLNASHSLQLSYYARAVEALFGKAPDRTAVYSTHAGRLFDVDLSALKIPDADI